MKSAKKKQFLKQFREVPIVTSVCRKIGISRQTAYRWRETDREFCDAFEKALDVGKDSINDLAESTVINNMKQGGLPAAKYWLSNNHDNYIRPRVIIDRELLEDNASLAAALVSSRKKAAKRRRSEEEK